MPDENHSPVVETKRLLLRRHRLDDFDAFAAVWADPNVVRYITGKPSTREESWGRYLRIAGSWGVLGFGFFAVEDKATGAYVGDAGFHDARRDIHPSIEGVPEAGWVLSPSVHGKGFATEIVTAMHEWGDGHLKAERSVCIIGPENIASIRVAEKCGYTEKNRTTYHGESVVLFERRSQPRPEVRIR